MSKYPDEAYVTIIDEENGGMVFFRPLCGSCHWYEVFTREHCCKAFPEGIPPEIWGGNVSHEKPIEGDGGYYFVDIGDTEEIERRFKEKTAES